MNKLLLLLLFVTPLFGQGIKYFPVTQSGGGSTTVDLNKYIDTNSITIYYPKEVNDIRLYHVFINLLVKDWDTYAKECYDDSSKQTVETHYDTFTKEYGGWSEIKTHWIHPKPTPQGFMEYLRRKR